MYIYFKFRFFFFFWFLSNISFYILIDSFKDQVVWITGASSGIGEQIALNLSKYGAKLVLSARSKDKLHQVKNRCIGNYYQKYLIAIFLYYTQRVLLNKIYYFFFLYIFTEISGGKLTANDIFVLPMDVTNMSKHVSLFDNVINHFGKVRIITLFSLNLIPPFNINSKKYLLQKSHRF